MKIEDIVSALGKRETLNETLDTLSSILLELDDRIQGSFIRIIQRPELIQDTGRFASVLAAFHCGAFIDPLVATIGSSDILNRDWLPDYLYALGNILDDFDGHYHFSEDFIHLLGSWIENADTEISWKSAVILSNIDNPLCYGYYLNGVHDTKLFHQTRIACLNGLVNHYGTKETRLYYELLQDADPIFCEAVQKAIQYLEENAG